MLDSIKPLTKSAEQSMPIKLADGRMCRISLAVHVIRYGVDFVVIARSKNILNKYIVPAVNGFLMERGLDLSPKIFCLKGAQLNFLGYTFKYREKRTIRKKVIAVYPIRENVITLIRKIKEIFKESQNSSAMELITKLNPII